MPTIVHFEIPADDVERSKKFYSDLFGWKIEKFTGQTGAPDKQAVVREMIWNTG